MLDLMDFEQGRAEQTLDGKYFRELPEGFYAPENASQLDDMTGGAPMPYEMVDPTSYRYKSLLGNLMDRDGATLTIKTRLRLDYRSESYISAFDGRLYQITAIVDDVNASSAQARRILPLPYYTEYILRLVEVDNPRRIR